MHSVVGSQVDAARAQIQQQKRIVVNHIVSGSNAFSKALDELWASVDRRLKQQSDQLHHALSELHRIRYLPLDVSLTEMTQHMHSTHSLSCA
jgi:hypothetical protein